MLKWIRGVTVVGISLLFLASAGLLMAGLAGPTVLLQRGIREPVGLGQLPDYVFEDLKTRRYLSGPRLSSRPQRWFHTGAWPGEFIVAFDARTIAIARAEPREPATSWFGLPRSSSTLEHWISVPTVAPLVVSSMLLLFMAFGPSIAWMVRRSVFISKRQCKWCRYDLTGNQSGVCPECGSPISPLPNEVGYPTSSL